MLLGLRSAGDVNEVGVGEASGLTAASINGNTNVKDVLDLSEQVYSRVMLARARHIQSEQESYHLGRGHSSGMTCFR